MTDKRLNIEELIEKNKNLKVFVETVEEMMIDLRDEYVKDIMGLKSVSLGEALQIARACFLQRIEPKSDEFYEFIDEIETGWDK